MFDIKLFEQYLATSWLGRSFFYFPELDSTNLYAKSMDRVDTLHGALIVADSQSKGRGQYSRNWESTPEENLTFSLVFEPSNQFRLTILTLACALAVSDVCAHLTKKSFSLKWPNDILFESKKISGLLTEAIYNGNVIDRVVIGIGININQKEFSEELEKSATSLGIITDKVHSREKILCLILSKIEFYYRLWSKRDIELIKTINKSLIGYGEWVNVEINDCKEEGKYKFLGVNENGALVLLNKELEVNTFSYEQVRIKLD